MILIAIATGRGLQERIRQKIASLNGHIQIFNYDTNRSEVSVAPISMEEDFYTDPQFFNRGGGLDFDNRFDVFEEIAKYESFVDEVGADYFDGYQATRQEVFQLHAVDRKSVV